MPDCLSSTCELSDQQLSMVLARLAGRTIVSCIESYKSSCVKRRITARIRRCGCQTVEEYLERLNTDPDEAVRLSCSLSIHVSQFFRNASLFETLQQFLLPKLMQRAEGSVFRCWSMGCSAGQEPYSLAMLLMESFANEVQQGRCAVLGTDIDSRALAYAETGCYDELAVQGVSPERKERFFRADGRGFCLCSEVRSLVCFRQMDLQQLEQYQPAEMVLCRNTLIYFNRTAQEKILHGIADILPEDGILVLGKSESMPAPLRSRFATLNPVERIYSRR